MPFIPIPNTVRVCVKMTQNGESACNVYHVNVGEPVDEDNLASVGTAFASWAVTYLKTLLHPATTIDAIEAVDASVDGGMGIIDTTGLPIAGTQTGNPVPNNVSVAIKLLTGFTGRSHRGRKFLAGLTDAGYQVGAQKITNVYRDAIKSVFENLLSILAGIGFDWVVASLFTAGAPRVEGVTTPISGIQVDQFLDSMRKRLSTSG